MSRLMAVYCASLVAAWTLGALELWRLAQAGGGDASGGAPRGLINIVLFEFGSWAVPTGAIVGLAVLLLRPWDRIFARRRLILAALLGLIGFLLGRELATGGGVKRAGLEWLVIAGVPLLCSLSALVLPVVFERVCGRQRVGASLVLLSLAVLARFINQRVYVGLYAEIHDLLFVAEILTLAAAFRLVVLPRRPVRAADPRRFALFHLVILAGCALWMPLNVFLDEPTRARFGRDGFHSARFLRWRSAKGPLSPALQGGDEALAATIDRWDELAVEIQPELDRLLPNRRDFNLVWISVDTLRPDRVGAISGASPDDSLTPAIDGLAREAAVFRRCWAQYPSTQLSSASMFTGRYATATPIYRRLNGSLGDDDAPAPRFTALLTRNGFAAGAAVAFTDEWMKNPIFAEGLAEYAFLNEGRTGAPSLAGEHFARSAMHTIDRLSERRFFLWFHLFDPHHPYDLHPELAEGEDAESRYDAEVRYADVQVGKVLDHLRKTGLWDRTVIVFNSDHGEAFGEHEIRYHGSSLHDEQIRVPLIIRVPGLEPRVIDRAAENVDLFITASRLLGLKDQPPTQGTDLTPLLVDPARFDSSFPDVAYAELPDDVKELSAASANLAAVVKGDWKLIRHLAEGYSELYDIASDPEESRDLAATEPARKSELESALVTLANRTRRFGRQRELESILGEKRAEAERRLAASEPFDRVAGILYAREEGLQFLGERLLAMAASEDEIEEIRQLAFETSVDWDVGGWRDLAKTWSEDPNPVLAWSGGVWAANGGSSPVRRERFRLARLRSAQRLGEWVALLRRRLPDRYLSPLVKRDVLSGLGELPDETARSLARHLLAGWDPAFHQEATAALVKRYGEATVRRLTAAQARERDARDLLASGRLAAAAKAISNAASLLPEDSGAAELRLVELLARIAISDLDVARGLLEELRGFVARVETDRRPAFWRDLIRRVRELSAYDLGAGLLHDGLAIRVESVRTSGLHPPRLFPDQSLTLDLKLANESPRALPGGDWSLGGRLRVLWTRSGETRAEYGTEVVLDTGLLPGESREESIEVQTPHRAGTWRGRVIINQQGGARFHQVETASGVFEIVVEDPERTKAVGSWHAVDVAAHFDADPSIRAWELTADASAVSGVATGYDGAIVSPPLTFEGEARELVWRGHWRSTLEGADFLRLSFIPLASQTPPEPILSSIARDGREQELEMPLPSIKGRWRLRLQIGIRQGLLSVDSVEIR